MKRSTKMLMMAGVNKRDQEYNRGYRMEYGPKISSEIVEGVNIMTMAAMHPKAEWEIMM